MSTLCEAVKEAHVWTAAQKNSMRRLFEHAVRQWPNLVVCIRETQGQLVLNASERGYNFRAIADFDLELVRLTDEGKLDEAVDQMAEKLKQSVDQFFPDCSYPNYLTFLTERLERRSPQRPSESACPQPQ
jgi:hypothetical protein